MADTTPLYHLIKKHVTQDLLNQIATEYAKGRLLFIGTVNLDCERPVVWNITKIAASHSADSLELVHKILRASAAIPGAFPPGSNSGEISIASCRSLPNACFGRKLSFAEHPPSPLPNVRQEVQSARASVAPFSSHSPLPASPECLVDVRPLESCKVRKAPAGCSNRPGSVLSNRPRHIRPVSRFVRA
jgi:hypothetical protein